MAVLRYVGVAAQFDVQSSFGLDIVTQSYVTFLLSLNMTSDQVSTQIAALLAPYATQSTANSLMTGLATPSYVNTQVGAYVQQSLTNQPHGPLSLDPDSDLLAPGLINGTSTQTWPLPFWSPTSYPSGQVAALGGPQTLFTLALPDPGYSYVVSCFGMVDAQVQADDGSFAEIAVTTGSATGPTIAVGYSNGESYVGPAPGDSTAQVNMGSSLILTGAWVNVSGWIAQTGPGLSSVVIGSYLQVPESMNGATLTVSLSFSGALPRFLQTVQTTARIVDSLGVVIATGSTVGGNSGTLTVSWTGNVVAGHLYGVQVMEGATGNPVLPTPNTYGTVSAGAFTINPPTVLSSSMANIIPVSLGQQTPITGPTTLFVVLNSSNSAVKALANTTFPALWAMPIPWAITAPAPPDVVHNAVSTGFTNSSIGASFTDEITVAANAFVITYIVADRTSTVSSITCGGIAMTLLAPPVFFTGGLFSGNAVIYCYGATIATPGATAILATMSSNAFLASFSSSYLHVSSVLASRIPATNNASPSQGVTCVPGQMIVQGFASATASLNSPAGGVLRFNTTSSGRAELCIQDATASTVFSGGYPSAQWWAATALVLLP